jgi:hypothetical protein
MIAEVKRLLEAQPFEAFSVVTTSGKQYECPVRITQESAPAPAEW